MQKPSFLHEIVSKTMRSGKASQPVLTSDKLLYIERSVHVCLPVLAAPQPGTRAGGLHTLLIYIML